MKEMFFTCVCLWAALLIEGCPQPPITPAQDAAPLSDNALKDIAAESRAPDSYDKACQNLARLGCIEGLTADCGRAMRNAAVGDHFTTSSTSAACIIRATTVMAVRVCPGEPCR